jgi:hypothetical protein
LLLDAVQPRLGLGHELGAQPITLVVYWQANSTALYETAKARSISCRTWSAGRAYRCRGPWGRVDTAPQVAGKGNFNTLPRILAGDELLRLTRCL